ncbi:outer membrane protein assembly factor [Longimicrobium terrae]|uniref:Outer membrane protein assembly factor BamA n=1 Tax=Longimicrobium terrae TaxID=1639882 RepID=A0A841GQC7_9BACT|nr:POTRA domain-containing protein [Longimicrobium terrae]MBB4635268.1 outer membrane protein assembly factor BamA [Longimicrobium terrae]MBB6069662.1 outer membrane protein assembly factor BamA [Longimicrobium terrae]NNC31127.1 BamA/TamA family outer membrane protein [Longimicrobium terrae]
MHPTAMLGLLLLAIAGPARAQAPAPPRVEAVRFSGVRALPQSVLRDSIDTRRGECGSVFLAPVCAISGAGRQTVRLDTAAVRLDEVRIAGIYAARGYPDARAVAEVSPSGTDEVTVTFRVTEGEPVRIRTVRVTGGEDILGAAVDPMPLRAGGIYAPADVEAARQRIGRRLTATGRAFGQVEVQAVAVEGRREVDLTLQVTPGPVAVFGATSVSAERPLRDRDIRSRLAFRPGERFSPAKLDQTLERLYALPVVRTAEVIPRASGASGDTAIETLVTAEPGKLGAYQFLGTVSSTTCLGADAMVSRRYAFGAPRTITLGAGGSNLGRSLLGGAGCSTRETGEFTDPNYYVRADLHEPLGADTWLLLRGAVQREVAPGAFIRRGVQARAELRRTLAGGLQVGVAYSPERGDNRPAAPVFCAVAGECTTEALDRRLTLAPLEVNATWSPRRARRIGLELPRADITGAAPVWLYSLRGSLAGADAITGSEYRFATALLDGAITRLVSRRAEVAAHARLGVLVGGGERLPAQARLYGGGPRGVRGVPQNLLGPRVLLLPDSDVLPDGCTLATGGCEGVDIDPDDVRVRAVGGDALAEINLESRLWLSRGVMLAGFVDVGMMHADLPSSPTGALPRTETVVSPGLGVMAGLPFGALRLDAALDTRPTRMLPLVTRNEETGAYINLGGVQYDRTRGGSGFDALRRRITFQISTGIPF